MPPIGQHGHDGQFFPMWQFCGRSNCHPGPAGSANWCPANPRFFANLKRFFSIGGTIQFAATNKTTTRCWQWHSAQLEAPALPSPDPRVPYQRLLKSVRFEHRNWPLTRWQVWDWVCAIGDTPLIKLRLDHGHPLLSAGDQDFPAARNGPTFQHNISCFEMLCWQHNFYIALLSL